MALLRLAGYVLIAALPAAGDLTLGPVDDRPGVLVDGRPLFALDTLWVANDAWQQVDRAPAEPAAADHTGPGGTMHRTVTRPDGGVQVRYEFDLADHPASRHLQWVIRLEPGRFDGALIAAGDGPLRPIDGARFGSLKSLRIVFPTVELAFDLAAGDGEWSFQDARQQAWAKCYRLEYNRDIVVAGKRSGHCALTVRATSTTADLTPVTTGRPADCRSIPFRLGPLPARFDVPAAGLLLWHTAPHGGAAGQPAGRLKVGEQTVELRFESEVTAADDDPRDLPHGVLVPAPDGRPAWLTFWRNPSPDRAITSLASESVAGGWELLGVTAVDAGTAPERLASLESIARGGRALSEQQVVDLNGTWQLTADGGEPRDVTVPARLDTIREYRGAHTFRYQRVFDVPASMAGQRLALRCDAVGEQAEVWVNGRFCGTKLAGPLPVEFDITERVEVPSSANTIEIRVLDDTHFSVPRESADFRNLRHWVPHGIGGNNRKGLFQNVSLIGRPPLGVADAQLVCSVKEQTLTVTWELTNPRRDPVEVTLAATVHPFGGGPAELTLPPQTVTLGGQVVTTHTVTVAWPNPRLWQPDHPHLYVLRTIVADGDGQRLCRHEQRFGFREVGFEGIHFMLNGIRCNLRGESPSYAQSAGLLDTPEQARAAIRKALAANFNVWRFHAAPAPPHVLDACDELGLLVIDESAIYASWQMLMPEHPDWPAAVEDHLTRWVRRDRNHPAVVLWSAENEGLNVSRLSVADLARYADIIRQHDATRPVIFDGDGSGYGASPASVKHYVRTIDDLQDLGGKASGYGKDLRHDIYWAAAYQQTLPLGIGEFLFPANDGMRQQERDVLAMMGLQTRGYRYANWFDIRPYNPFYIGYLKPEGIKPGYEDVWDIITKSFAPVAVFDKQYDSLGPFPDPPVLAVGQPAERTLIVYNDTFADEHVTVVWEATQGERRVGGESLELQIPLGGHLEQTIRFTPPAAGQLELSLISRKGGGETFRDMRRFEAR